MGFSNYDTANTLVKVSRLRLVCCLCWAYVASSNENVYVAYKNPKDSCIFQGGALS
jgi:hypothetical protein